MSFLFKTRYLLALAIFFVVLGGCKKSEPSVSTSEPAAAKVDFVEKAYATFPKEELVSIGEKIYHTKGMQTCLQCHRAGGEGEGYAGAASLQKPWTWRSFNALGGYDELARNPAEFRKKMSVALTYLIHEGGLNWNKNFALKHPDVVYDWSKTGKDKYDMMMWGVAQSEMKVKVKKVHEELAASGKTLSDEEMSWVAAVAAFEYVKKFEKAGKGKDGKPAAKIWE